MLKKHKAPMKEIKDNLSKRRGLSYSWPGRFSVVKMPILTKVICEFIRTATQTPAGFVDRRQQADSEIQLEGEGTRTPKTILKKKKVEDSLLGLKITVKLE